MLWYAAKPAHCAPKVYLPSTRHQKAELQQE